MFKFGKTYIFAMLLIMLPAAAVAARIEGQVQVGGGPVANSTVTLWGASVAQPRQLAQTRTGSDGRFELASPDDVGRDVILYLVAKGGDNPAIALLSVLGNIPPPKVVMNELTTVASTFTSARFIKGEAISGNPLGLRIAAGNAPNLVDPATGGWGKVLLDPLNSTQTTTLAKLNTLGSLITAFATVANDDWRTRFLKAATPTDGAAPKNTLEAMAGIARESWADPKTFYALFDEAYPQPRTGRAAQRRSCRTYSMRPTISRSCWPSPAAACSPMGGSCSTQTAIFGAGRTGCPDRNPASSKASVAASSR